MPSPPRRPLGRSGLNVAPLALGGNVFGWTVDERTGFDILDAFVEAGFNLIDTADVYNIWVTGHQGGESESILGRWFRERGRRQDVLIATKVGMDMRSGGSGLSAAHIARSVEGSLRRLQTDTIDLYQAHEDDPATPLAETLGAFQGLIDHGTVRAIGASNYGAPRLRAALEESRVQGFARYESLQPRYNLMDRGEYEAGPAAVCAEFGLGVLTYSSLASGFLTGKYRSESDASKSPRGARATSRLTDRGRRILAALDAASERMAVPRSTVALAWLMDRPGITAPIASATSVTQLRELLAAATVHLDASSRSELDRASAPEPSGATP